MRTVTLVLLVLVLLGAAGLLAFSALRPLACPDDGTLDGAGVLRPECASEDPAPAPITIREELPPAPVATFDEEEFLRLQGRGGEAVHGRDLFIDVASAGGASGRDLVEAVAGHLVVRLRGEGTRAALDACPLPPRFQEEKVALPDVLDFWRMHGFEVDDGSPVLVIGRPGS